MQEWYDQPFPSYFHPSKNSHILLQATTSNIQSIHNIFRKLHNHLHPYTDATIVLHMEDPLFPTEFVKRVLLQYKNLKHRYQLLLPKGYYTKHNLFGSSHTHKHNLQINQHDHDNTYTISDSYYNHPYFKRRSVKQVSHAMLLLGIRHKSDSRQNWPGDTWNNRELNEFQTSIA